MFCCWNPFKGRRLRKEWGDRWLVKVVVVGDSQCGKTNLIQRYCCGTLPRTYTPTLFDTTTVTSLVDKRKVQMIIQDTAGQEDLDGLRPPFYLHADVVIVCFCPSIPGSWEKVREVWVPETRRYCSQHVPVLLVANKTDQVTGPVPPTPGSPSLDYGEDVDVDRLRCSVETALRADNPALRGLIRDDSDAAADDDKENTPSSPRDSGFFEWTEALARVSGGSVVLNSGRHSVVGSDYSRLGGQTELASSDRPTHGGSLSSRVDQLRQTIKGQDQGGEGQDRVEHSGHVAARQIGAVGYFETSAVLDQGIEQVFETALTAAMASRQWKKKYRL